MRLVIKDRGDTIIEVLFAITVFSMVAVGGLSLMNQGTALAQRSLEISLVRAQIDAQADALRYLNHAYIADYGENGQATERWNKIVTAHAVNSAQNFDSVGVGGICHLPNPGDQPFAIDVNKLDGSAPPTLTADVATYARIRFDSSPARAEGIWIQAVRSVTKIGSSDGHERPGFYDFHIRACWQTPGQSVPVTLGTIVRLYEPRG